MGTTVTQSKLIGTLAVVALIVGALLVPTASARTVEDIGLPQADVGSVVYGPDAFERAVIAQQSSSIGDYRDAGHAVTPTSGAMVYPDAVERSMHLRRIDNTPTGSVTTQDDPFDWGQFALFASLGGIAVLGAATLLGLRQRTRLA